MCEMKVELGAMVQTVQPGRLSGLKGVVVEVRHFPAWGKHRVVRVLGLGPSVWVFEHEVIPA